MTLWVSAAAATLGRDHAVVRRNRQDAAACSSAGAGCWGVVADGCGQAPHSEVGAQLSVAFAGQALGQGLSRGEPLEGVARGVVSAVIAGLGAVAASIEPGQRARFIAEHLLATVLGFVTRGDEVVAFAVGDGVLRLGERCLVLDQGNAPRYPALELLGKRFDLCIERGREHVVAVATDGLSPAELGPLLASPPHRVARRLTVLARAELGGDDAAVAFARREGGRDAADAR